MKTRKKWLTATFTAILMMVFISGCLDENVEEIGICPEVISTDPANLETGVNLDQIITVTFNGAMDPATITLAAFTLLGPDDINGRVSGALEVSGSMSYNETSHTMSFEPDVPLQAGATYTGTVKTLVKDVLGNALQANYVWEFNTATIPAVVSTGPLDLATNVPLDGTISADFNQEMDPSTLTTSSFTVSDGTDLISGQVTYSGTTATFTPDNDLMSGTTYTATITTDATSAGGVGLVNDYEWTFSTNAPLGPGMVDLKSVKEFGIFAGVGISNNAGFSEIHDMNVGITPGVRSSITGFPPAIVVNGAIYASDDSDPPGVAAMLQQAKDDLVEAYLFAEGATSPAPATVAGDQGGKTLAPGIYKSTSTLLIQAGDLTLDAQGDANAVWIFQIASDFTTVGGAGGNVILSGGAQASNVFWQTGSSATIGDGTSFKGNIMALTSITMNSGATAEGRMLARNGSVVMTNTNIINRP